jgi:hypothetical protein
VRRQITGTGFLLAIVAEEQAEAVVLQQLRQAEEAEQDISLRYSDCLPAEK